MDNYILDRLRADAAHLLALGENEAKLQHQGLKGRFRELLIDNLLTPWLPSDIACGTGMIIAAENVVRKSTQDDVIIFDKSLAPPILASANHAPEGVFLYNSVVARIEVKSSLTRAAIGDFILASREIAALKHSVQPGFSGHLDGVFNLLFAYSTDAKGKGDVNYHIKRIFEVMNEQGCDPLSGVVSMVCIPPHGFWKLGAVEGERCWERLVMPNPEDTIAWFVGCVSNSCYRAHALRQGRDPAAGLETGIGMYLLAPYEKVA